MRNPDVFPTRDNQFDTFQESLMKQVNGNQVAWGFTVAELAVLNDQKELWKAAWKIARNKDNRTTVQTTAKTNARKEYQKVLRPFIKVRIHGNPKMTQADMLSCGVKPHKLTRTPVPDPKGIPALRLVPKGGKQVSVYFNPGKGQDGSSKRAMPKGTVGLLIGFKIGGTPPLSINDCRKQEMVTKSPYLFSFADAEPGLTVYAIACWLGTRMQNGPFCEVQHCIIY